MVSLFLDLLSTCRVARARSFGPTHVDRGAVALPPSSHRSAREVHHRFALLSQFQANAGYNTVVMAGKERGRFASKGREQD